MVAFLSDENIETRVVARFRGLGYDVITAREAGLLQTPDPIILSEALKVGRVVLTHDRDYISLHKSGFVHAEIVCASYDVHSDALADRIHDAVTKTPSVVGCLMRVYLPS